jgi:hypothetical protein
MHDTIILIGRPAAGKSEIIDYLASIPDEERSEELEMGPVSLFDDFPYLWEKFEEDDILERHGRARLWTDERKYFTDEFFWVFMIEKLNLAYRKQMAQDGEEFDRRTKVIEFARGGPQGYAASLDALCDEIVDRASIVYVKVPFEVSFARNRRRARPGQEHSILHHSLPDEKMTFYYKIDDWEELTGGEDRGVVRRDGRTLPFVNFVNEPEQTDDPARLGPFLAATLSRLPGGRG